MTSLILVALILGSEPAAGTSLAPESASKILENPERSERGRVELPQVAPSVAAPELSGPSVQVNQPPRDAGVAGQLSKAADRESPGQVYRGSRSAAAADPLSRPRDGRTGAVARVEGQDRCDPQAAGSARNVSACANVIETRSEEFRRPDVVALSPEQRLLIEQRARERSGASAARRIGAGTVNPDSLDDQAIAAITLDRPAGPEPAPDQPAQPLPSGADALINAIVNRSQPQN